MKTMYMVGIALLLLLGLAGVAGFYNGSFRLDSGRFVATGSSGGSGIMQN